MQLTKQTNESSNGLNKSWTLSAMLSTLWMITACATQPIQATTTAEPVVDIVCDQFRVMSYSLKNEDETETSANQFDTEETALQVYRFNRLRERLCRSQTTPFSRLR